MNCRKRVNEVAYVEKRPGILLKVVNVENVGDIAQVVLVQLTVHAALRTSALQRDTQALT